MTWRRTRGDEGAVAVLTAVVAVLLLVVAALAVELTSAYARDLAIQSVADVAARDAAAELPLTCNAIVAGAQSLAADANRVADDADTPDLTSPATFAEVPAVLLDGDPANGEITVFGPDVDGNRLLDEAALDATACPDTSPVGTRVRVVSPPRTVRFSFGQLAEREQVTIRAAATAGIVSALPLLPLALPVDCAAASHLLVLRQPGLTVPDESPADPAAPQLVAIGTPAPGQLEVRVREDLPRPGPAGYAVRFSGGDEDYYGATSEVADVDGGRTVTVAVPAEVAARSGGWAVSVSVAVLPLADVVPAGPWSATQVLTIAEQPVPMCDPSGRYGDLLTITPSLPASPPEDNVAGAAADGLTFSLGATVAVNGPADHNAVAERLSEGLLTRLTRPSSAPCADGVSLGVWSPPVVPTVTVTANNALSCYWPPTGATVAAGFIDEPRAFLVPVVDVGAYRPTETVTVPVLGYVAAYVTDEDPGRPDGLITTPTECGRDVLDCNGIRLTPTGSLERLTLFRFDPGALPPAYRVRDNGHPFTVGTKDVLLLG